MPETNATLHNEKPVKPGATPLTRHTLLVAVACFLAGLLIGRTEFAPTAAEPVHVDERQMRAIIEDVLDEYALEAAADADAPDRFALVDDDPYLGDEDAPVVIVEFSDFFCSYCKRHFDQTFAPLLENYGAHIRYVYRDFARLTPESTPAAAAAQCAFEQGKFWEFRAAFFENQDGLGYDFYLQTAEEFALDIDEFTACVDEGRYVDEVDIDGFDGQIAGVRGTPAFFINGQLLSGAQPYSIFERMIRKELDKAGLEYAPAG